MTTRLSPSSSRLRPVAVPCRRQEQDAESGREDHDGLAHRVVAAVVAEHGGHDVGRADLALLLRSVGLRVRGLVDVALWRPWRCCSRARRDRRPRACRSCRRAASTATSTQTMRGRPTWSCGRRTDVPSRLVGLRGPAWTTAGGARGRGSLPILLHSVPTRHSAASMSTVEMPAPTAASVNATSSAFICAPENGHHEAVRPRMAVRRPAGPACGRRRWRGRSAGWRG